ncbi:MAG: hypothetical protein ACLRFK_02070, partial [Alphaproteobacteria bacterium]
MKQTTLTTWLLKLPFKFAIISLALILLLSFLYPFIGKFFHPESQTLPIDSLFALIAASILASIYFAIRKAPKIKMDTPSFITIHTAQVLLMFLLFSVSTYLLLSNQQNLLFRLMLMESKISGATSI